MSKKENMIVKTNFIVIFVLLLNLVFSNFKNFVFASPITIEAENYSSQSGCTIAKNYPGYSGSGFLDYGGQNSYGEWNVNVSSAGEYDLKIRYANGSTSNRQCELKVNGIVIGNIPFTKTSSWSNWLVTTVTINLSSGNNTVRITANTSSGGPNIDKFDISASSGVIVFTTTSDGRIMKEGQEFVVKGVNANGPHWAYSRATIPDVPLMKTWGFNTVRVLCYPRLAYNGVNNNTDLDGIIDAITSRGMVAIIENHDTTGVYLSTQPVYTQDQWGNNIRYPSLNEFRDWWVDKANKYKNNQYVWFNIANEPGGKDLATGNNLTGTSSMNKWYEMHDMVIAAVRAVAPNNIIVIDDHLYGSADGYKEGDASSASATKGPQLKQKYNNLVFSLHTYDQWADAEIRLTDYIDSLKAKGLPLIIGEYGDNGTKAVYKETVATVFNVCKVKNIGRIVWGWDNQGDTFYLCNNSSAWAINKTDGSKPTNLSWVGSLVWDDNRNQLSIPINVNVPPITNGGFESDMTAWTNWRNSSVQSSVVHSGSKALEVTSGNSGGAGQFVCIKRNSTYKLGVWGRHDNTAGTETAVGVKWTPYGSSQEVKHQVTFTENNWTYKEITFTTPNNDMIDRILYIWKVDSNRKFYVDDITLTKIN